MENGQALILQVAETTESFWLPCLAGKLTSGGIPSIFGGSEASKIPFTTMYLHEDYYHAGLNATP